MDSDDEESTRKTQAQEEDDEEETDSEAEREEMEAQRKIMEANAEKEKVRQSEYFFKKYVSQCKIVFLSYNQIPPILHVCVYNSFYVVYRKS